jgi:antitoxin (DNA-binding transcriptional repressor) of toxin-antitoxin stability system
VVVSCKPWAPDSIPFPSFPRAAVRRRVGAGISPGFRRARLGFGKRRSERNGIQVPAAAPVIARLHPGYWAADGEAFIIAKGEKPMVKVVPLGQEDMGTAQRLGFMSGEFEVPEDFDRMAADGIQAQFSGLDP